MRTTVGSIAALTGSAQRRLGRLQVLAAGVSDPLSPETRRVLSYVVIEAANLWAHYSQAFYFSVAFGARDATGMRVIATPLPDVQSALDQAVYALNPKLAGTKAAWKNWQLPDWQNKGHLSRAVAYLGASVWPQLDSALSIQTRVLVDLPTMRNFYAHKAERGARAAGNLHRHYAVKEQRSPHELLCVIPPGRSDILLNDWLADMAAILRLMP